MAVRTPLVEVPALSARSAGRARLRSSASSVQPIGAFKIRGAYNAIARLAGRGGAQGVITQSSGNHGQAVAFAAAPVRPPRRDRDARVHARHQGRRGAPPRRRGGLRRRASARPSSCARAEAIAAGGRAGHDPAVRPPRRRGGAGHHRPRDPGAAPRRRDDPGPGERRRAARRHLRGGPGARSDGGGRRRWSPPARPSSSAALAAGEPRTLERTESLADGLLTRSVGALYLSHPAPDGARGRSRWAKTRSPPRCGWLHREAGVTAEPSGAVTTAALLAGKARPPARPWRWSVAATSIPLSFTG